MKSVDGLKKALDKYLIPIPAILNNLEQMLKDVSSNTNLSSKYLKGSDLNVKNIVDDVSEYEKIRYVFILF